jgi:hypothetical protein
MAELTAPPQPIRVPEPVRQRLAPAPDHPDHIEGWFVLLRTAEQRHDDLIQLLVAPAAASQARDVEETFVQRCRLVRRQADWRGSRLASGIPPRSVGSSEPERALSLRRGVNRTLN